MAIDIRADVSCSLGTLISGSISDDYIQGNGLIKCQGSCEISGTITPAVGTVVTFSYTKDGSSYNIPRKLRVISSFADPFRRVTSVQLGCKLTYLQELKEEINWDAFNDPENAGLTSDDAEIITIPLHANSIAQKCLDELGITTPSIPLANKFSISKFDFSSGYVSILSNLLASECYCGYLDFSEVLQIFSVNQEGGTGPVLDYSQLIDISQIGSGDIAGDAVTVSYSTRKLNPPNTTENDVKKRNWEYDESIGVPTDVYIASPVLELIPGGPYVTYSDYVNYTYTYIPRSVTETSYDTLDRVSKRKTTEYKIMAEIAPGRINNIAKVAYQEYLSYGGTFYSFVKYGPPEGLTQYLFITEEEFFYEVQAPVMKPTGDPPNGYEKVLRQVKTVTQPLITIPASTGIYDLANTFTVDFSYAENSQLTFTSEKVITTFETYYDDEGAQITKTISDIYRSTALTNQGQQLINTTLTRDFVFTWWPDISRYLSNGKAEAMFNELSKLKYIGKEIQITTGREISLQRRPTTADRTNNGYTVENKSELNLSLGSATAQRVTEFSLPYAPDDTFYKEGSDYFSSSSDADLKATNYGRTQNRLLFGNRNGMNIQVSPEILPSIPFSPIIIQANGLSGLYRINGTNWTMGNTGIVASSDLLFWGAVGGTGDFWFPVAPGVTTLPSAPPVVNGEMTVSNVVKPWNETSIVKAVVKNNTSIESFPYAFDQLSDLGALATKTKVFTYYSVPSKAIQLLSFAPNITTLLGPDVDPYLSNVNLLLHMDGVNDGTTFIDSSTNNSTITKFGTCQTKTAIKKYGTASIRLSGSNWLGWSGVNLTGDFTIEAWVYLDVATTDMTLFGNTTGNVQIFRFNGIALYKLMSYANGYIFEGSSSDLSGIGAGTWHHVAMTRSGTVIRTFLNGILKQTNNNFTSAIPLNRVGVGASGNQYPWIGYMDEVRITDGLARYTSNFPVPVKAFPGNDDAMLVDYFINSDSTPKSSLILNTPSSVQLNDLLVAVIMSRLASGSITPPSGWSLHTGNMLSSILVDGGPTAQYLHVYTKTATGSEPSPYTWTGSSSVETCGLVFAARKAQIDAITSNYGNSGTATITTADSALSVTVFTWVYTQSSPSTESYSQSISTGNISQISDSPMASARISGAFTYSTGTVTSTHSTVDASYSPNHGGICIQLR